MEYRPTPSTDGDHPVKSAQAALQLNLTVYNTVNNMNVTEAKCPSVIFTFVSKPETPHSKQAELMNT